MRQQIGRSKGVRAGLVAVQVWAGIIAVGASVAATDAVAASAWAPSKAVELIVPSGTGGGNDKSVRVLQQLLQKYGWVTVPMTVLNKPGGGQAVAYAYVGQRAGDGHYLTSATMNMLTNRLMGSNPLSYRDMTPVVQLTSYNLTYVVKADSPIKSFKDIEARLKADPQSVVFGVSTGAFATITTGMVAVALGIEPGKIKRVVFRGGGELMTAVLGGHVDIVAAATTSVLPQHKAGAVRILGVTAPRRLGGAFAEIPTIKEQGVDVVSANWYNLMGPPGMSPEQIGFWEGVLEKATATPEWKREIERNIWDDSFLKGKALLQSLQEQEKQLATLLTTMGLAKQ